MLHGHRPLAAALLLATVAGPVLAEDATGPGQLRIEPRLPQAPAAGDTATPNPGVTVLAARSGDGVRVARAADGEGRPVSPVALEPASGGRGVARARGASGGFGYRIHPILRQVRFHAGIDIARAAGTRILAANDGVVVQAGWAAGYGLLVTVDHGGGVQTRYAHLSGLGVRPGQRVRRGDVLGAVGSTGLSTGPHLHYEVRRNGQPVSPLPARPKP